MRYLDSSYVNQSVYIVAEGSKIVLMSTAPYVDEPVRGRVASITRSNSEDNDEGDNDNTEIIIPSVLGLTEVKIYDESHVWDVSPNLNITIPYNSIVIKNGRVGDISLIKPGDEVRLCDTAKAVRYYCIVPIRGYGGLRHENLAIKYLQLSWLLFLLWLRLTHWLLKGPWGIQRNLSCKSYREK